MKRKEQEKIEKTKKRTNNINISKNKKSKDMVDDEDVGFSTGTVWETAIST